MTEPRCCLILTTTAELQQAQRLASELVSLRLAACINILPTIQSVYEWEGKVQQEAECQLLIKTTTERVAAIKQWLAVHHPYELPECLVLNTDDGSEAFIQWLQQQVSP